MYVSFHLWKKESHSERLLSRIIISVTSLLTFLSNPWVLPLKSDAYIALHSFLIMEVQGLTRARESLQMTSRGSMDSCQDESGECGQTESRYVREQNPPSVRELPIQSTSKYE